MIARYTDGTLVQAGDSIRYHQQPGGMLPAGDWKYGTAALYPYSDEQLARMEAYRIAQEAKGYGVMMDPSELHLMREEAVGGYSTETRTAYYHIAGHVVERVS